MKRPLVLLAGGAGVVALSTLLVWAAVEGKKEAEAERRSEEAIKPPSKIGRNAAGETVIRLEQESQTRGGLKFEPAEEAVIEPEVAAYGRLEEDPAAQFVVRSPVAGTLRQAPGGRWPGLGQVVADGTVLSEVEPRFAPADRLGIVERLSAARSDAAGAAAAANAARAALERARTLNADSKNVSDRAVQEAEARLNTEEARARAAADTVRALEGALDPGPGRPANAPLVATRGGEAVEILARPGESVESGQPVLRLVRFDSLIARVTLPAGETAAAGTDARIVVLGRNASIPGQRIGPASPAGPNIQGSSFLVRVGNPDRTLRPGLAVTVWFAAPGASAAGARIPSSAIVRNQGRTWAYVQTGAEEFTRREIVVARAEGSRALISNGVAPGEKVVWEGAELLLSEELKTQIQVGE